MKNEDENLIELIELLDDCSEDNENIESLAALLDKSPDLVPAYVEQFLADSFLRWSLGSSTTEKQPSPGVLFPFSTWGRVWQGFGIGILLFLLVRSGMSGNPHEPFAVVESLDGATQLGRDHKFVKVGDALSSTSMTIPVGVSLGVRYDSGVRLQCTGPSHIELATPELLRLHYGRITARAEGEEAKGYTVSTEKAEFVDVGTEFGIFVDPMRSTDVVVFDGNVKVDAQTDFAASLDQGMGLRFTSHQIERVSNVYRDSNGWSTDSSGSLFMYVRDNLRDAQNAYYEIVTEGLVEDAKSHVDRDYEWNGVDADGMPQYLYGAELVRTFNIDKNRSIELQLELRRECMLFLFWDQRAEAPKWLIDGFVDTGDIIGLDEDRSINVYRTQLGIGPGNEVDLRYSVWVRIVKAEQPTQLKGIERAFSGDPWSVGMYGLAAQPLHRCPDLVRRLNLIAD